ncbi:MAG: cysteine desulfurase [Treponema sp.]|jgi:cysteine desulfurase|nr:cysteine desulfurase [Treponema sp.]
MHGHKSSNTEDNSAGRYYFDWAATAIPDSFGVESIAAFGNPSSLHREGRQAKAILEAARSRCAAVLGVSSKQLYFTSGGTESNALALHSMALRKQAAWLLASAVEHPSVRENCLVLERLGKQIGSIGVEKDGRVSPASLEKALDKYPETRFAAIMALNNETGAVMDIPNLVRLIRARGGAPIHVHSDLVQAIGKIPVDIPGWDLDSASISAHKLGGPRGIGLLYLRKPLDPIYTGGGQEGGIRPGTENTAGAVALAACLERRALPEIVKTEYEAARCRWKTFIAALRGMDRCTLIPQDRQDRWFSPWIVQAAFKDLPGEVMVRALDDQGFAVSTGSACSSSQQERPVLVAMGVDERTRREGIRISQGWSTTTEDIGALTQAIREILNTL